MVKCSNKNILFNHRYYSFLVALLVDVELNSLCGIWLVLVSLKNQNFTMLI